MENKTYRAESTRIYGDGVNITACLGVFALFGAECCGLAL